MTFDYTIEFAAELRLNFTGVLREHLVNAGGRRRTFMKDERVLPPYPMDDKGKLWEVLVEEKKRIQTLFMVETGRARGIFHALALLKEQERKEELGIMEALL